MSEHGLERVVHTGVDALHWYKRFKYFKQLLDAKERPGGFVNLSVDAMEISLNRLLGVAHRTTPYFLAYMGHTWVFDKAVVAHMTAVRLETELKDAAEALRVLDEQARAFETDFQQGSRHWAKLHNLGRDHSFLAYSLTPGKSGLKPPLTPEVLVNALKMRGMRADRDALVNELLGRYGAMRMIFDLVATKLQDRTKQMEEMERGNTIQQALAASIGTNGVLNDRLSSADVLKLQQRAKDSIDRVAPILDLWATALDRFWKDE